jgi:hypothetical protein
MLLTRKVNDGDLAWSHVEWVAQNESIPLIDDDMCLLSFRQYDTHSQLSQIEMTTDLYNLIK